MLGHFGPWNNPSQNARSTPTIYSKFRRIPLSAPVHRCHSHTSHSSHNPETPSLEYYRSWCLTSSPCSCYDSQTRGAGCWNPRLISWSYLNIYLLEVNLNDKWSHRINEDAFFENNITIALFCTFIIITIWKKISTTSTQMWSTFQYNLAWKLAL